MKCICCGKPLEWNPKDGWHHVLRNVDCELTDEDLQEVMVLHLDRLELAAK